MKATAFAPATVANVAVGFDLLGFALKGLGEFATVERIKEPQVIINPVAGHEKIPTAPEKNTAGAGLVRLIADKNLKSGFRVTLQKQIPIGSGLGGSSASAVAAIVAANALLPKKLARAELMEYALIGEEVASGARHADNIAPCLEGGLVFVRCHPRVQVVKIKTPATLRAVIALPQLSINTKDAREILNPLVPLPTVVKQTGNLAGFLLGCAQGDFKLMGHSLNDVMIEPQRSGLIPCFGDLKPAALKAGAIGCSISGSGPAIFALANGDVTAKKILKAWTEAAREKNITLVKTFISPVASPGARVRK